MKRLLALLLAAAATPAFADTLVTNINGMQVGPDGQLQRFRALTFGDDGKVRQVIANPELVRLANITAQVDGGGRTLLPGLIDAHGHVGNLGLLLSQLDLVGSPSLDEMKQRLARYAAANPQHGWLVGRGWNQELWPTRRFPTASDLDAVVADRPVALERVDGHAYVVNSAALRAAGINAESKDPAGGRIERDSAGQPTGVLVDTAAELVLAKIPAPSLEQRDAMLLAAQDALLSSGLTAVADMGTSLADWQAMNRASVAGALHLRILIYAAGTEALTAMEISPTPGRFLHKRIPVVGVKLYGDGALGSRGAWLKAPYADSPQTSGLAVTDPTTLRSQAKQAAAGGYQVAIHAIGDRANAEAIGIFEQLGEQYGRDKRWRIEHAQVVDPADIPRLAPAGIIASMQPIHQVSDRTMAEARLGPDRLGGAYAWQTILRSGARLAFGSDFPVEPPNPFLGLSAAVSRQDPSGVPAGGWRPHERVSFAQALAGFTRDAAYAGFAEDRIGSLEPGKWADFILVDRDVSQVDAQSLARTQVVETWIAGKRVWQRGASAGGERGK